MSFINKETKEINYKIVYYGCPIGGKSTSMQYIYNRIDLQAKSEFIHQVTEVERICFFDFLPKENYKIEEFTLRYHLYTVPGVVFYDTCRRLILQNVDGIIFVADSQRERMDHNIEYLWKLDHALKTQGDNLTEIPYALQLNKRDLPGILTIDELKEELIRKDEPVFESVAYKGIGVYEAFTSVALQIWQNLQNGNIQ